jgi:hypothetical protein
MKILDITLNSNLDGIANPYLDVVKASIIKMKTVLESNQFETALIAEISKCGLEGELSTWKNAKPETIYNQYLSVYNFTGMITLQLVTYTNNWTSAIGEGGEGNQIKLNTKFLGSLSLTDLSSLKFMGSLISHEYGHKRGFEHEYNNTSRRPNSICYIINRAFEKAFDEIFGTAPVEVVAYVPWYKRLWYKLTGR